MHHRTLGTFIVSMLVLSGCDRRDQASRDSAAAAAAVDPTLRGTPDQMAQGASEMALRGLNTSLGAGFVSRELTMEDIRKLGRAATNVRAVIASDSQLAMRVQRDSDRGLDSLKATIAREPKMREAIERAGLAPDDYVAITGSVAQAMFVASMMRPNAPVRLREVPPGVSASNVRLVTEHDAEVRRLLSGSP